MAVTLYRMECIDLTDTARKIKFSWSHLLKKSLMENFIFCGVGRYCTESRHYFSYDKKLEQEKNVLNYFVIIQNILKLQKLRNLTIEERIVVFKSLATSKITHLALVTEITYIINLLNKI